MKLKVLTTLLLVALLTGCATTQPEPNSGPIQPLGTHLTPDQQLGRDWKNPQPQSTSSANSELQAPYWENPEWIDSMGKTIQDGIHYPTKLSAQDIPAGSAEVQFTYVAGTIRDVAIVASTGSQLLDKAITEQVSQIALPPARGTDTGMPHRFLITVHMVPPEIAAFYRSIWKDIQEHVRYPVQAIRNGAHGIVFARFKYRNGVISDVEVYETSGSSILDRYVISELSTLLAPSAPPWVHNRTLKLSIPVEFCLEGMDCTDLEYHFVAGKTAYQPVHLCADIAFNYMRGKVSDAKLAHSSGNAKLDKVALAQIAKGDFPITAQMSQALTTHFEIPVCYQPRQNAPPAGTVNPPAHASG